MPTLSILGRFQHRLKRLPGRPFSFGESTSPFLHARHPLSHRYQNVLQRILRRIRVYLSYIVYCLLIEVKGDFHIAQPQIRDHYFFPFGQAADSSAVICAVLNLPAYRT